MRVRHLSIGGWMAAEQRVIGFLPFYAHSNYNFRKMAQLTARAIITNLTKSRAVTTTAALAKRTYATEANPEDYGYCTSRNGICHMLP